MSNHDHHHWLALAGFLVFVFWAVVGVVISMLDRGK